jgi:SWI/SNF-related matrix-associated actin-dependent regulator of chromatin subfamily A-like protein 1
VIGLTGTPIVNRPIEAWNILYLINKKALPSWRTYTQRYCAPTFTGFGWDYSGASNTEELHQRLVNSIMLRRCKADVLDLPKKIRSFIPLPLSNQSEYRAAENDLISYLNQTEGKDAAKRAERSLDLVRISKLRMLAARGKLDQMIEWIGETIEDHKLVVFAIHREIMDPICEKFKHVMVKIAGDVSEKDRLKAIDQFQTNPKVKLFVGQVQAAGTGITLTAACHVAFLELPWTPGDVLQAEDRCHRIGQDQPVVVYYLLAANTIDEKMAQLIDRKRSVVNAVTDGSSNSSPAILRELLALYKRGNHGVRHFDSSSSSHKVRNENRNRLARTVWRSA